jgi:hypothetical protein
MLGLIEAYLFLTFLLRFSKSPSGPRYGALFALSVALFLTHPWTWGLIITASLVFALSVWKETGQSIDLRSIIGIITGGIVLDLLKSSVFGTRTVAADVAITVSLAGTNQLASFWTNLVDALLFTHGGLLANWIVLALGLVSVFALRFKDRFERLLILWIGVASVPFLAMDSYHQARILYDLPIPLLASMALLFILPQIRAKNVRWPGLLVAMVLGLSASYAIQGMLTI